MDAKTSTMQLRAAKLLTELVGTMFLCLTVATTGSSQIAPIAIGCVLVLVVYAGGHVSGGHYNPAVTLAVLTRGGDKICPLEAALYILSQVVGAFCAALLSWPLIGKSSAAYPAVADGVHPVAACLCEAMITFALCSVVLHTATTTTQEGNSFFGLAIGFTVLSGAVSVGRISGGAFNPAVGSMPLLYGSSAAEDVWIYWLAPLSGGLAAGCAFRALAWKDNGATVASSWAYLTPCAIEAIGTMMLCFTVGTAASAPTALAPLAIGSALMVMIYMGGWISGGHFNPAVTLAVFGRTFLGAVRDRLPYRQAAGYVLAQLLGSAIGSYAASVALQSVDDVAIASVPASSNNGAAFLAEVLGTFLLTYTVLNVATVGRVAGNSYFGLAIGMCVTAMACGLGPVSGGAFNPAVGMMGAFLGRSGADDAWIYWMACLLGGALASCVYRVQNFQEFGHAGAEPQKANAGEKATSKSFEPQGASAWQTQDPSLHNERAISIEV